MSKSDKKQKSNLKKGLRDWGIILGIVAILYVTGLHTNVIGTMQRAMLWTGFFDAKPDITSMDGPELTSRDFSFRMRTNEDELVQLSDFRDSVTFINIWASWCPPCIAEMPTIETLYSDVQEHEDIQFIMLSMDEERQAADRFMNNDRYTLPYHFPESALPEAFRASQIPRTYVISPDGQIVYKKEGLADYSSPHFRDFLIDLADS